jgi:ADP-heptose:LPS heptosyltransferase
VIEIGNGLSGQKASLENYVDLQNQTSLEELVALIAAADIFVGPVSGPVHIAAAVGTAAVVIIGGYEHPTNTYYNGIVNFYTPLACAPCWLTMPYPFDLRCLRMI